ncbi:MAG: hypothetical protein ABWY54_08780 [Glaciihabitans sp.]
MAAVGVVILIVASVIFLAGLVAVVAGSEVAIVAMIFAFGLFTLGTGMAIAARRSR